MIKFVGKFFKFKTLSELNKIVRAHIQNYPKMYFFLPSGLHKLVVLFDIAIKISLSFFVSTEKDDNVKKF